MWTFLLLFAMSFSVLHDYTFAIIDDHSSSVGAYVAEFSSNPSTNQHRDNLCDIHFEYHTPYLFLVTHIPFPSADTQDNHFTYDGSFLSLSYFNFFKPPIA